VTRKPSQPLLMLGDEVSMKPFEVRERKKKGRKS
jgi:hypothetical protein